MSKFLISIGLSLLAIMASTSTYAASVPNKMVYNAHLLTSTGAPITTAHSVRFSIWDSTDFVTGDTTGVGAINVAATTYLGWNEVQSITPNTDGFFTLEIGDVTTLPSFDTFTEIQLQSMHLQVEVKAAADADTAYELLDINFANTAIDRSQMLSVPFALNAETVDRRHVGTASGAIPILGVDGLLDNSYLPNGITNEIFTIDSDDTNTGAIALQFGTALAKQLIYDTTNSRFNFNDSVQIEGNLTVTGLINGIDISTITPNADETHLKVSSGAGLALTIAGGSYRINGAKTDYAGGTSIPVTDNTTNFVYFASGGLSVNTIGFPTGESYIPLAEVTTLAGAVTQVAERRVLQSDDRERQVQDTYNPEYADAAYEADGTSNVGRLVVRNDTGSTLRNYYEWGTTASTLQDYDVYVRVSLPQQFVSWQASPLSVAYKSTNAVTTDNKLDIAVFDSAGSPVTVGGSATDLASATWTTTNLTFSGGTWIAGSDFVIRFRVSALGANAMQLGAFSLKSVELNQ